ncbi:cancer/testis antigen 55 [Tupaia chinensis]|uniref:Uncharacterized protein n=1 Tax=Tupaia chinensis TaxID=246437 RepID=L9J9H9_TUPCH|nr:cancer/testis antigen 55 [Tupaia chinensis]ELW46939.1 hypothetical protein TREES_T100012433 [Tupaia chinensis]
MLRLLRQAMNFFRRRMDPTQEQQPQQMELLKGDTNMKAVQGVVTRLYSDYGLINESIYFSSDVVTDNLPLKVGQKVTAIVEEREAFYELNTIKVDVLPDNNTDSGPSDFETEVLTACVAYINADTVYIDEKTFFPLDVVSEGFMPYKGDWVKVDYSIPPGTSFISVHLVTPLTCRRMEEVCITTMHGRHGVIDGVIFFTLDSLELPNGYIPQKHDIVNVVIVESIQLCYIWRAISMTPVQISL